MNTKANHWMPFEQEGLEPEQLLKQLKTLQNNIQKPMGAKLAQELSAFHQHAPAKRHLEQLRRGEAVAVITGQQPCLWGGPSLVIHKILSAISISAWLNHHDIPAVPMFWNASEDHDLQEMYQVDWCHDDLQIFTHKKDITEPLSAETQEALNPKDIHSKATPWVRSCFETAQQKDYGRQSSDVFRNLFAKDGLVVIEPRDLSTHLEPFWQTVENRKAELIQRYDKDEEERLGRNLPLQAPRRHPLPIFHLNHSTGQRVALNEQAISQNLLELPHQTRLSPGALLRPITASFACPILVSVLGPAEMKYHHQIHGAFETLDVERPVLWPRLSGTWMPTELEKELRPLGINIQEMIEAPGSARDLLGDSLEMKAFSNHLTHLHHDIEKRFPGHGGALEQFERDIFKALGRLDRNMRKLNILEKGIHPKRWAHVQGFLLPRGAKQERRLAWAQILKNPEHLEDIAHVFSDPFDFRHRIYA